MANPLNRVSRRNLMAHKVRLLLTVVSVVLGVAFVAGSFVFTDTLKATFDKIFATSDQGVDVQVTPRKDASAGVPLDLVAKLRTVPGVRTVEPDASGAVVLVGSNGKPVQTGGAPSIGGVWHDAADRITPADPFASGHAPEADGQVVLNSGAADKAKLAVGDHTKVVVPNAGIVDVSVVGVYSSNVETGGYVGVLFSQSQALSLFTDGSHVDDVSIAANDVSQQVLRDRIAAELPPSLQAKTGDQVRADDRSAVQSALSFINYFLLAFGLVALIVGTFIISNTFSMLVASRTRELALLRAIGASRGQVRRSVLTEAALIGILGSLLGVAGGVGLAYALRSFLDSIGSGLPDGPLTLLPRTVIVAVLVGTIVTVVSANGPARRAARTAPVEAMRTDLGSGAASLRLRTALGCVFTALGLAAVVGAVTGTSAGSSASFAGLGLLGVGIGVLMLAPVLARVAIGVLGRPLTGPVGRLARTNAVRNPRRTAATAFALTLGLLLVSGIAVIGASTKTSLSTLVDTSVRADYIMTTDSDVSVPVAAGDAVAKVPGIASTVTVHGLATTVGGSTVTGDAVDGQLSAVLKTTFVTGGGDASGTDMLVSKQTSKDKGWHVGSQVTFTQPGGASVTEHVTGVYQDDPLIATFVVSGDTYRTLTPTDQWGDEVILVRAAPGTNLATLRSDLENATDPYYVVTVRDREQFKGQQASQVNGLLGLLYGLLGLAVVISVLGIINTLALSVVERRREIGMLRAVGMQRAQVRRTIWLESLLVAVFGAITGVVLGLGFGALFTHTLRDQGLSTIDIPWVQAIGFVVVSAVVGVLAALWPARRAAKTPPLAAIATVD